jgi:hypothetical protein
LSYLKEQAFRSEKFRKAVASLECGACGSMTGSQAAHQNEGKGMGLKVSDVRCAALCVDCHRELDQGTKMTRQERRDFWKDAYIITIVRMIERGLLEVKK